LGSISGRQVVDRLSGEPVCGPDTQGELCVRTPQLLMAYRGEQEEVVDSEGYFHTGDLGYYDKDGVIHFVEQLSSLISFWMYEVALASMRSGHNSAWRAGGAERAGVPPSVPRQRGGRSRGRRPGQVNIGVLSAQWAGCFAGRMATCPGASWC
jgi:acyl-CoA synthetase (AMP-forming)/AMP-acid ligase II